MRDKYENEIDKLKSELREEKLHSSGLEGYLIGAITILKGYIVNNEYIVELTAYTARPEETNNDPTNTAIMELPVPGWTIAVSQDLKFLLGKRVYIEGYGIRRVNDLMNSRYTNRIDILVGTVSEARKIGLQEDVIMILIEPREALKEILYK